MNNNDLTIHYETTDYSETFSNFYNDSVDLTIDTVEYLYVGYKKPINQIYMLVTNALSTRTNYTVEYFDGTNWQSVIDLKDGTEGWSKSGFICWQEYDDNITIKETDINGVTKYWFRLQPDDRFDISLKTINLIFSTDEDVYAIRPILNDDEYREAVTGYTDKGYINVHVEARDELIQDIRNTGAVKSNSERDDKRVKFFYQITMWDLFDITEIRQAAKNLALSNIYYSLSDAPEDKYEKEAERFKAKYDRNIELAHVSLDLNNDGKQQNNEVLKPKPSVMTR